LTAFPAISLAAATSQPATTAPGAVLSGGVDAAAPLYLIWAYCLVSLVLLFAVQRTRLYPLYLLKTAWVVFTIMAFGWVVMMSGATDKEFTLRPAGVFGEIEKFPQVFTEMYRVNLWWLTAVLWLPVWLAGGASRPRSIGRLLLRGLLLELTVLALAPVLPLAAGYDWSPYTHFVDNYRHAWQIARMGDYFLNSVLVSICSVALVTTVASMAAYALTRLRFPGRSTLSTAILACMAIPGFVLVVPLFIMMKGWTVGNFSFMDSRTGLAVLYAAGSLPFTIFVLSGFYRTLPGEMAESAAIDGASPWQIFSTIYFPLSAPGLATVAIFNFLGVWNEYNFALIFLTNPNFKTLPVGLYNLQVSQQYAVNWPAMFAGIVILCLPTFLIFVILQERIISGITVGAVKG
jgi:N-acetylglucosamine transport system permease protein